ncbi:acyl-CoA carboxylase subunit epsilon [Nocardioides sp. KIGAM211]|uniref:Acyl-CoA carboxylase subunit epsilon n=1 Tax=Nocardioides luti TaxID=2761101 RepID=A0A7X0VBR4_9ACTN|nr:acyl-CoA carboxylase subunit epsilon [Nocardioides luti]MBB6628961.1 acyl-CoA carboxylase subunit epsilon [Nocardioides luti]
MADEVSTGSTTGDGPTTEGATPPLLRVVSPDATPEEIAALVAVLSSLGGAPEEPRRRTPAWQSHQRRVRPALAPGPGGWRASGLPR